jgi:hypothetical protein
MMEGHYDIKVYDENGEEVGFVDPMDLSDEVSVAISQAAQAKYPKLDFGVE